MLPQIEFITPILNVSDVPESIAWASTPQDLEKLYQAAVENEIKIELPVTDQPWGAREFRIMHPDGHILRINVVL